MDEHESRAVTRDDTIEIRAVATRSFQTSYWPRPERSRLAETASPEAVLVDRVEVVAARLR